MFKEIYSSKELEISEIVESVKDQKRPFDDETTEQPADGSPIQMAKENTMEKLNEDKPGIIASGFGKVKNFFGFGKKDEEQEPEKQLNEN